MLLSAGVQHDLTDPGTGHQLLHSCNQSGQSRAGDLAGAGRRVVCGDVLGAALQRQVSMRASGMWLGSATGIA